MSADLRRGSQYQHLHSRKLIRCSWGDLHPRWATPADSPSQSTLAFNCTCSNGTVPDTSLYQSTVPFYVCQANFGQCIANSGGNLEVQGWCKGNATCGTLNATAEQAAASSTSAAPSTSQTSLAASTSSGTSAVSASAPSASKSTAAAVALQIAQDHSTGLFTAAVLAALGLLL
jgi:hypothetical protein